MPHHKSAQKRVRQTVRRTMRNKRQTSATRTAIKKVRLAIASKDKEKALQLLPLAQSRLGRLAKIGAIKGQSAARRTSRLAGQIAKI